MTLQTAKIAAMVISCSLSSAALANTGADNSKRNADTQAKGTLTSQDQSTAPADVELTRRIRQEVMAQNDFSTNAKNVKIITIDGVVTLKGPVKSEAERNVIARIASNLAGGNGKVINQISIE